MAMKPRRMTRRGLAFGKTLGTPAAKSSNISDSGSRCMPVATADRPSATDRNSGTTKKIPACTRNRKKNEVTPSRSWMLRSIFGSISAAWPRAIRRFSHAMNRPSTTPPASTSQITGESPSHSGAPGLGRTNPHAPDLRMPITISPRPAADSPVPARSSLAPFSGGVSFTRRARARITITISTSLTNTHRHEA